MTLSSAELTAICAWKTISGVQKSITLVDADGREEVQRYPLMTNGYEYEAMHVMDCLSKGVNQSDIVSWQASTDLMSMMDTLRKSWGVRYPGE